jgi:uncharacterized tellurite resistance protein B-like protein
MASIFVNFQVIPLDGEMLRGVVMLDTLKKFIQNVGALGDDPKPSFEGNDYRLAAAALLVHVVNSDGTTAPVELARLTRVIEAEFGLDAKATAELLERAAESDREAVDFYRFTSLLKRTLDDDERRKIVEMMWDVAFADGVIDEFEENTIWRVAELLDIPTRERVLLRQRVAKQSKVETAEESGEGVPAGPWSLSSSP